MGEYAHLGGSETAQAGQTLNEKFAAGIELTMAERKQLDVKDPRVAGKYLADYGGRRIMHTEFGPLEIQCDGHIANSADAIDSRWQADLARQALLNTSR